MPKTSRKIIAIGGGEIVPKNPQDAGTREIDQEIIRLTNKKHPKLLFIPTASHDAGGYVENIRGYF
jgi:dipeptidase E